MSAPGKGLMERAGNGPFLSFKPNTFYMSSLNAHMHKTDRFVSIKIDGYPYQWDRKEAALFTEDMRSFISVDEMNPNERQLVENELIRSTCYCSTYDRNRQLASFINGQRSEIPTF